MTTLDTATSAPERPRGGSLRWVSRYGTLVAFIALILFNIAVTPNFLSWQMLNVNLTQVATIVIVAVGMTLVIATGGIDLSVGSLMAISGALAPMIFLGTILPIPSPALAVALAFTVRRSRPPCSAGSTAC
jgi:ribose/xylose/arabinose/galactoside ABC-type transport system permease subunit